MDIIQLSDTGSERATNDPGKIVTAAGQAFLTWQEIGPDGYRNMVTSSSPDGRPTPSFCLNIGVDNHARSVITIDSQGYLHAVLGGHCSPVHWRRSLRPYDISAWTEPVEITTNGTYPILVCDANDTLYLALRGPLQNGVNGVVLFAKARDDDWRCRGHITANCPEYSQFYAAYQMRMAVSPDGRIHALLGFYEGNTESGRGFHQAMCYAVSEDGGQQWLRANGEIVPTPARPEALDVLLRSSRPRVEATPPPEMSPGGLVIADGEPLLFYISHHRAPGEIVMATWEEGNWRQQIISKQLTERWSTMHAVSCAVSQREDGVICLLVGLTPFDDRWRDGKPTRAIVMDDSEDDCLAWLIRKDEHWTCATVLDPGQGFNNPSVESPNGHTTIAADRMPDILYYDGSNGYPGGGEYYDKPVAEMLAAGEFVTTNVHWIRG